MLASDVSYVPIVLAVGVLGAFFLLLVLVSYFELRYMDPYVEIDRDAPDPAAPPIDRISPYVVHMSSQRPYLVLNPLKSSAARGRPTRRAASGRARVPHWAPFRQ